MVKDTTPDRICFFFRPDGTLQHEYVEDRRPGKRFIARQEVPIHDIRVLDPEDLAVICVSPEVQHVHNVVFYPLDNSHHSPSVGRTVMVLGFPSAISERVWPAKRAANRAITYQKIIDPQLEGAFDHTSKFATDYTYGGNIPPSGIHPGGFSGAGAWYESDEERIVWHAKPKLAGIVTNYFPRKRVLAGVRVETLLSLLDEIWP